MEHLGPIAAPDLASRLGLPPGEVSRALLDLEAEGSVLRGRFTPGLSAEANEWCDRRLLARIHRLTIGRLRREIEPVPAADFLRFLLRWQHVQPGTQLHGRRGLLEAIGQLQGLELPAPAWERHVLPARIAEYDPDDLEALCLSGAVAWARLKLASSEAEGSSPPAGEGRAPAGPSLAARAARRRQAPTRSAPLAFVLRESLPSYLDPAPHEIGRVEGLSPRAREIARFLEKRGASFLSDIARGCGLLLAQVEWALWELVARGLVTGDGIAGLRALLLPERDRLIHRKRVGVFPPRPPRGGVSRDRVAAASVPLGRWSLLRAGDPVGSGGPSQEERDEAMARQLLRRYGVVLREVLAREGRAPSWRTLLSIYRRLEARGEIRGGRFLAGFVGEQFALPEAVEGLRAVRRQKEEEPTVVISAADPLNLLGLLTPGARISPASGLSIAYRSGVPVETGELGAVRSRLGIASAGGS
jgi:ATP-dependent Lhr-like helicase